MGLFLKKLLMISLHGTFFEKTTHAGCGRGPTDSDQKHHRWIANGSALGPLRSTQVSISLLTWGRTLPLASEVGTA